MTMAVRRYFDAQRLLEIETPILAKSTPEGARDYLVPSRVHPGRVLRAAAVAADLQADPDDRRAWIATSRSSRCFRDEDLRADRQLEFTQVDVEMSFARPETIFGIDRAADAARCSRRSAATIDDAVPPDAACRGDRDATGRTSPTCAAASRSEDLSGRIPRRRSSACSSRSSPTAASSAASLSPGGNSYSRSQIDVLVDQAKADGIRRV